MFGFSLAKLLFTVAVVILVWYAFKWMSRVQAERRRALGTGRRPGRARPAGSDRTTGEIEETVRCPACGDYVAARGAHACGRDSCPYP